MGTEYERAIAEHRERKDEYFAENPHSPIPSGERDEFEGLSYYPPDPEYQFELELHEHDQTERVVVETTADGQQEYVRVGEFRFEVDGEAVVLQAYEPAGGEDRLWVPFRDATSGEGTYGAGRYLDLEPDTHRTGEGTWLVDFNAAYNPTCAYNDAYECPLPPAENWLDVAIEAGEQSYH